MSSCLILSHGKVAEAYLDACQRIVGECKNLYALNCEGYTPKVLYDRIAHLIETNSLQDGLFILVSLRGGSCWNAAAAFARNHERVEVISGLNLSLLLCFVTKNADYSFEDFGDVLMQDAVRGVSRLHHPKITDPETTSPP